jgi:hypothetical protein
LEDAQRSSSQEEELMRLCVSMKEEAGWQSLQKEVQNYRADDERFSENISRNVSSRSLVFKTGLS